MTNLLGKRIIAFLLAFSWSASPGLVDNVRKSISSRPRVSRSVRLDADHHSDDAHEGESLAIDAHRPPGTNQQISGDAGTASSDAVVLTSAHVPPKPELLELALPVARDCVVLSVGVATSRGRAPPVFFL